MKEITKERIKKIKGMDTDLISLSLITANELMWSLDRIIDRKIKYFVNEVDKNVRNKKWSEEIKEWLSELGESISSDYLIIEKRINLSKELIFYLGFDGNDEVIEDIIDEFVMSCESRKDINQLKRKLIKEALELDDLWR
ncbi:hypothetical protein ACFQPF_12275 [Fictibacillus iocasae]|uniref:Uncharacterized protein n=1 Tax=Fictibacillus iocasae TaxID=2715437 RepID=A0ABW2NT68_9BACL